MFISLPCILIIAFFVWSSNNSQRERHETEVHRLKNEHIRLTAEAKEQTLEDVLRHCNREDDLPLDVQADMEASGLL